MKALQLERINTSAPYKVEAMEQTYNSLYKK